MTSNGRSDGKLSTAMLSLWLLVLASAIGSASTANNPDNTAGQQVRLFNAVKEGALSEVEGLLAAGANPDVTYDQGKTPLMLAAIFGKPEIVALLLSNGAKVNRKNVNGDTALILAAYEGCGGCVQALILAGAKLEIRGKDGRTALSWAVKRKHVEAARILVSAGANVNARINAGSHYFSTLRDDLEKLGQYRPDTDAENHLSPLALAIAADNSELIELLTEAGAVREPFSIQVAWAGMLTHIAFLGLPIAMIFPFMAGGLLFQHWKHKPTGDLERLSRGYIYHILLAVAVLGWTLIAVEQGGEGMGMMIMFIPWLSLPTLLLILTLGIWSIVLSFNVSKKDLVLIALGLSFIPWFYFFTNNVFFFSDFMLVSTQNVISGAFVYAGLNISARLVWGFRKKFDQSKEMQDEQNISR